MTVRCSLDHRGIPYPKPNLRSLVTYNSLGVCLLATDRLAGRRLLTITTKRTRHLSQSSIQQTRQPSNVIANGNFSEELQKLGLDLHGTHAWLGGAGQSSRGCGNSVAQ
jgi:hypothetical protein